MSSDTGVHESRHPTLKQYVGIAIFLFAITIVEFVIILPVDFRGAGWTIAPLAILSAIKFAAVIFFYMHLKFDNRLLTWVFLGGLALGFAVVFALIGLFGTFTPSPRAWAEQKAEPCIFDHENGGCIDPASLVAEEEPEIVDKDGEPGVVGSPEPIEPVEAPVAGLAAEGQALFTGRGVCVTCHKVEGVEGAVGILGPELTNVATVAATRQPGVSAEEYLVQSIVEPDGYIVEGYPAALMNATVAGLALTDAEVDALVAFLLELE